MNPDPQFRNPKESWRPYSLFHKAEKVSDWRVDWAPGKAVITGSDCQPQARVGIRSLPIPLPAQGGGVFRVMIDWRGEGIHRAGALILLVDGQEKVLRQAVLQGPAGDFAETRTEWVVLHENDRTADPALLLYAYHDGQGILEMSRFEVREASPGEWNELPAPKRSGRPISRIVEPLESVDLPPPFPVQQAPVPAGEKRHFAGVMPHQAATSATLESRVVALQWEFATQTRIPFWVCAEAATDEPGVFVVAGDAASMPRLPELPETHGAYLHFYGDYRYGKQPADWERDLAALQAMRADGFTGAIFWDDYGLDFARWKKREPLDPTYLLAAARLHREAAFPSPFVYVLLAGIDRGRVTWEKDDTGGMRGYLQALAPHLREAEEIVGKGRMIVAPFDEPDDPARQDAALAIARLLREVSPLPMAASMNWQTARRFGGEVSPILGAGDFPSLEVLQQVQPFGFYCSLEPTAPPLRYRYLAGVHAWAAGFRHQAYWHHQAVSGEAESDLDGRNRDYMTMPSSQSACASGRSLARIQLCEGIFDWRLLLALEAQASGGKDVAARDAGRFLGELKSRVLMSDNLAPEWNHPDVYEGIRSEAYELWLRCQEQDTK